MQLSEPVEVTVPIEPKLGAIVEDSIYLGTDTNNVAARGASSEIAGIVITGSARTPSKFVRPEFGTDLQKRYGWITYGQLCKLNRYVSWGSSINHSYYLLDNNWFYTSDYGICKPKPSAVITAQMDDSPQQGLASTVNYSVSDSFQAHQMYIPPGIDSIPVSIMKCGWQWTASGDRSWAWVPYVPSPPDGAVVANCEDWYENPQWFEKYSNGQ